MFAWIDYEHFENQLMDEILSTALEWRDYEAAVDILEQSSRGSVSKDRFNHSLFTKFHFLAVIYDRQGITGLAERIYNRALSCMMDEENPDPVEVTLFLKNYASCLRQLNREEIALGLETIADTFRYTPYPNFRSLAQALKDQAYSVEVANVA